MSELSIEVHDSTGIKKVHAAVGCFEMEFVDLFAACKWVDYVVYGIQPKECIIYGGMRCGYPIDDCKNCPAHEENHDPYVGSIKMVIRNG